MKAGYLFVEWAIFFIFIGDSTSSICVKFPWDLVLGIFILEAPFYKMPPYV